MEKLNYWVYELDKLHEKEIRLVKLGTALDKLDELYKLNELKDELDMLDELGAESNALDALHEIVVKRIFLKKEPWRSIIASISLIIPACEWLTLTSAVYCYFVAEHESVATGIRHE